MTKHLAIRTRIEKRVLASADLIERMGITAAQFERVALNALATNPRLAECTPASLDLAVLRCAEIGLLPDGRQAAIVPYKSTATLIPMIEGRIALARRALPGLVLRARCVYRDDEFEHLEGSEPVLRHAPSRDGRRSTEDIVAAYATALAPGMQQPEWEVLYRDELDRYRAMSSAGQRGPWKEHAAEMYEKIPLGLVLKRLPRRPGDVDPDAYDVPASDDSPAESGDQETGEIVEITAEDEEAPPPADEPPLPDGEDIF